MRDKGLLTAADLIAWARKLPARAIIVIGEMDSERLTHPGTLKLARKLERTPGAITLHGVNVDYLALKYPEWGIGVRGPLRAPEVAKLAEAVEPEIEPEPEAADEPKKTRKPRAKKA